MTVRIPSILEQAALLLAPPAEVLLVFTPSQTSFAAGSDELLQRPVVDHRNLGAAVGHT